MMDFTEARRREQILAALWAGREGERPCYHCARRYTYGYLFPDAAIPVEDVPPGERWECFGWKDDARWVCAPCLVRDCDQLGVSPRRYGLSWRRVKTIREAA